MAKLQVYDARERAVVWAADQLLRPLSWFRRRRRPGPIRRVLLLRLERIGDLLMTIDAIRDAHEAWPDASIDLAVGSWNETIAGLIPDVSRVDVLDLSWLARGAHGDSLSALITRVRRWRWRQYDLVVNFEPDIRTNALTWLTGAARRAGYTTGGGGAFLTDATVYEPGRHVSENAAALIARAAGRAPAARAMPRPGPRIRLTDEGKRRARDIVGAARGPFIGIHASGGRESKQWHVDRFAAVARRLADARGATIVLTGSSSERRLIDRVRRDLAGVRVIDAAGALDLTGLAALLAELDVFVTGDTGPMHLAAAVGVPVVALFGPSDPRRYGPQAPVEEILRVQLPCSPCGQVRLPPSRCRGHVPECLDRITTDDVVAAALRVMDRRQRARGHESPI